jgi:hypothetical protein
MCNNSTPSSTSLTGGLQGYELTTGFDLVTGWGSVDVANLLANWGPSATVTNLSVMPGTSVSAGATVTLNAVVTAASGTADGSVKFVADGVTIGTATLGNSVANFTASAKGIAPGKYPIVAEYLGTSTDAPSNSPSVTVTVTKAISTATLAASPTSVTPPGKVTLTATVTCGDGTPTGTVSFYYGSLALGSATLNGGTASINASSSGIPAGTYGIHAVYSGNSSVTVATSNMVDVQVQ